MKRPNFIDEEEVFAVNPDVEANVHVIGPEGIKVVVLDNFYKNPDAVRDVALTIPPTENVRIMAGTPGTRVFGHYNFECLYPILSHVFRNVYTEETKDVPDDVMREAIVNCPFCVNINQSVNLPPVTPHIDDRQFMMYAAGIYLNLPEECTGGTSFYSLNGKQSISNEDIGDWLKSKGKEKFYDHYITDSVEEWELLNIATMKYNRLVMYPGNVAHTAYMKPDDFTGDVYRLIQMMFIPLNPEADA